MLNNRLFRGITTGVTVKLDKLNKRDLGVYL